MLFSIHGRHRLYPFFSKWAGMVAWGRLKSLNSSRSRGKDSEYENLDSDICTEDDDEAGAGEAGARTRDSRDSEQREIDEFEEEERRIMALEAQVSVFQRQRLLFESCP